jgi:hypothetical protein
VVGGVVVGVVDGVVGGLVGGVVEGVPLVGGAVVLGRDVVPVLPEPAVVAVVPPSLPPVVLVVPPVAGEPVVSGDVGRFTVTRRPVSGSVMIVVEVASPAASRSPAGEPRGDGVAGSLPGIVRRGRPR